MTPHSLNRRTPSKIADWARAPKMHYVSAQLFDVRGADASTEKPDAVLLRKELIFHIF